MRMMSDWKSAVVGVGALLMSGCVDHGSNAEDLDQYINQKAAEIKVSEGLPEDMPKEIVGAYFSLKYGASALLCSDVGVFSNVNGCIPDNILLNQEVLSFEKCFLGMNIRLMNEDEVRALQYTTGPAANIGIGVKNNKLTIKVNPGRFNAAQTVWDIAAVLLELEKKQSDYQSYIAVNPYNNYDNWAKVAKTANSGVTGYSKPYLQTDNENVQEAIICTNSTMVAEHTP